MTYPKPSASDPSKAQSVQPNPSFPQIEEQVLEFWKRDQTFLASLDNRSAAEEWVFYDGPPFANGLPHYGHLLTGYAKDVFPRYQTMRGKRVDRRFGWDTHGLPAELEAMKQLGITEKSEIEQMGVAAFNAEAKASVLRYTQEWEEYVTRQARWVDFENDYKTLNIEFMESVIWAFKRLYDKGLAYEGYRVLPYCWRDETPLSNHELRMDDDVYKMRQDQTVTVTFALHGERAETLGLAGVKALAWTTTPWTLPTNFALAVGPAINYLVIPAGETAAAEFSGDAFLLAEDLVASYAKELGYESAEGATAAATARFAGSELAGVRYDSVFDYYREVEDTDLSAAWQILVDDFVTTGDGTGIVHLSPAYGEEDKRVCDAAGIPTIISVDEGGRFLSAVREVAGVQVFEANKSLTQLLKASGKLLQQKSYEHSYPHCWRCRNPLIYKAVSSWFIRVTEIKDRMLELNEQINWVPGNVKHGQFGKWLENARDWSISRNRYWGSPIPVWKSDNPDYPRIDVYGSLDELERDFGVRPTDLHRPFIDELTRPNPDDPTGKSVMRRVEDVLDVWFDSGAMPFSQVHYPFDNQEWFDSHAPADFIVEYIGQTRGWFYTLHILSTALFDRPAYKNVISHGIVLGNDGQKMSKSLRNYPDVSEVFDRDGSDAMRWFLMSSPVLRGGNLVVTEEGIREGVRQFLLPLWNSWYFFTLYANASGVEAQFSTESTSLLDRYILAKTGQLVADVQHSLDELDSTTAAGHLREFAETLTNFYVRRSREKFWDGNDPAVFNTLYTVLVTLTQVAAPMAPLMTERVWQGLTGGRSVHLTEWPESSAFPRDPELIVRLDSLREAVSAGLALRKKAGLRVRLPLSEAVLVTDLAESLAAEELAILGEELNVKIVRPKVLDADFAVENGISNKLAVNARAAGPRLGKQVQVAIQASKAGEWHQEADGTVIAGGLALEEGEYEIQLETTGVPEGTAVALLPGGGFLLLNTTVSEELAAEGFARDMVRAVQDARRSAGLDISDRITLNLVFAEASEQAIFDAAELRELVQNETLTTELIVGESADFEPEAEIVTEVGKYSNSGEIIIRIRKNQHP